MNVRELTLNRTGWEECQIYDVALDGFLWEPFYEFAVGSEQ